MPTCVPLPRYSPVSRPTIGLTSKSIEGEPEEKNLIAIRRTVKVVLLSLDDPFCSLVRSYLQQMGLSVFVCSSAERATSEFLNRRDIDIWLIDVQSLGIEAMYFALTLRDVHPEAPTILLSGWQDNERSVWHLISTNWPLVRKPVKLSELLDAIRQQLSRTPSAPQAEARANWKLFDSVEFSSLKQFPALPRSLSWLN